MDRNNLHCVEEVSGDTVALRKESVDRNLNQDISITRFKRSLSARRAWIEIAGWFPDCGIFTVALRKESVDRNFAVGR